MILDYSTYVVDAEHHSPFDSKEANDTSQFGTADNCPFCATRTTEVYSDKNEMRPSGAYERGIFSYAFQCLSCGWWKTYKYDWLNDSGQYFDNYAVKYAALSKYDPGDASIPIDALRSYLKTNPSYLNEIDSYKTEELVGSVFSQFYDCDVEFVGKTGDGGIDLFLILGQKTIMVQVKNRKFGSRNWKSEPVKTIREFLGATIIKQKAHSILVSTAKDFTKGAKQTANEILEKRILSQYDLINGQRFLEMLDMVTDDVPNQWREHVWGTDLFKDSFWI